ncbi:hypothetical protein GWK47_014072 [Chionoecetes opilio]|uniref:Uncharacterized protein n=1 Tax=Chionoecetes opilio TaxID=41210 RepID=A0A8J5CJ40_CHIOP|nr:hypothetical protein GWK47_014072 [Chionoecetes opilio]
MLVLKADMLANIQPGKGGACWSYRAVTSSARAAARRSQSSALALPLLREGRGGQGQQDLSGLSIEDLGRVASCEVGVLRSSSRPRSNPHSQCSRERHHLEYEVLHRFNCGLGMTI